MSRTFWIVLGPTAPVACGYILVLRKLGFEPPYWTLIGVVAALALGFWWIGKRARKKTRV